MLNLLLDEHISPSVAKGLRRIHGKLTVYPLNEWEGGTFLGSADPLILREACAQHLTFVTYDQKTIRPLLQDWARLARPHDGVILRRREDDRARRDRQTCSRTIDFDTTAR